ncbi:CHAT domain-containing protein [Candidatus Oscillochloris fontis]|uniref:CHAT domain-containing protein n=1 Tax=Candidatus Oscillochloris fontis TaxID=2496868 RepID=UPI001375CA93|nr:tetratricopeptide repeat protein [Candidatus Oscillochloris fontis]
MLAGKNITGIGQILETLDANGVVEQITIISNSKDSITIQLPHLPRQVTATAAQKLLEAIPLETLAPLAPLPPSSRIFSRNHQFVGKETDLLALARLLKTADAAIVSVLTITGLGGIGKTQLAIEFAHRYGQFFAGGVFLLSFADPAGIPGEIAACGMSLNISGFADLKIDDQVQRVVAAWQEALPRLLIFDNCEDESLLTQWRPTTGGCRVVVTSRNATWIHSAAVTIYPMGILSRTESIALLRNLRENLSEDEADMIAEVLGDLPLALHLAGNYLRTYPQEQPATYLQRLDTALINHHSLMGRGSRHSPTNHELHVARTIAMSYDRLDTTHPIDAGALYLLARAVWFAPGAPFPTDLLLDSLGGDRTDEAAHLDAQDALNRLLALGLLEQEHDTLTLHRLLHAFVRQVANDPAAQGAIEDVLIDHADQLNATGYPAAMDTIVAHLRYATDHTVGRNDDRAASLCNALGYHLDMRGDYAAARPLYERTLAIAEITLGSSHPQTAQSLNNLATLLQTVGDYDAARPLLERALAISESSLGSNHPTTAQSLNNLATLLQTVGDYAAARPLLERALAIHEAVLGPSHPQTAQSLNNLATLLQTVGEYAEAHSLFHQALSIREAVLGPSHPATAISINNLALLYYSEGDYAIARPLFQRALEIHEATLGPTHPTTATSLNNLAEIFRAIGDYAAARPLLERALAIHEATLGSRHPQTAQSLNNLAVLLEAVGDYAEVQPLYDRALAINKAVLGANHPDTITILNNFTDSLHSSLNIELTITRTADGATTAALRAELPNRRADLVPPEPIPLDAVALRALTTIPDAYGVALTAMVFAPALREGWQRVRGFADAGQPVRVRLVLMGDDGLHAIRWELLRDPVDSTPLASSERTPLSRFMDTASLAEVQAPAKPTLHAVIAVANPDLHKYQMAQVDVAAEVQRAQRGLGDLRATILDGREGRPLASLASIAAALREEVSILYLVCHGTLTKGEPYLFLEMDGSGAYQPTAGAALVQKITALTRRPLLVVLASCQGAGDTYAMLAALGPQLARAGVGAVIAIQGNVPMTLVSQLTPRLFTELRRDGQIDRALAAARAALHQYPDWWMPTLWMAVRDGALWRAELPVAAPTPNIAIGTVQQITISGGSVGSIIGRNSGNPPAPAGAQSEAITHQHTLLATHRRTLGHYLQQLAVFGTAYAPPHIMHGATEARAGIARAKAALRALGVMVEDLPDDTP